MGIPSFGDGVKLARDMECYFQSTEPIALLVVLSHSPIPMLEAYSVTLLLSPSTTISMGWLLPVFTTAATADAVTQWDMECLLR